jgi:signal transduction histidine kinase
LLWRSCKEQLNLSEKALEELKKHTGDLERIVSDKTRALEDARMALQVLNIKLEVQKTHAEEARLRADAANAAKSEFLSSMSHELRTPLNAIIGFSEILQDRYFGDLNERQADYIKDIWESGKHLLALINDILDISKAEAGQMELDLSPVNINVLLLGSAAMIREKAVKHNITMRISVSEDLERLTIDADEIKIKQVIFNLLSNAAKFTPDEGEIGIEAARQGSIIRVTVTDSGIGISPLELENIFDPFYQVLGGIKDKTPGTGLGLALSRRFIEMHSGQMWAESKGTGAGSVFRFTLPIRQFTD